MLLGALDASLLTGRDYLEQEKEFTDLVIRDRDYLEQDKKLKKKH